MEHRGEMEQGEEDEIQRIEHCCGETPASSSPRRSESSRPLRYDHNPAPSTPDSTANSQERAHLAGSSSLGGGVRSLKEEGWEKRREKRALHG